MRAKAAPAQGTRVLAAVSLSDPCASKASEARSNGASGPRRFGLAVRVAACKGARGVREVCTLITVSTEARGLLTVRI